METATALGLRELAEISDRLAAVPGSAFAAEKAWRERTDLNRVARLETRILRGLASDEDRAEYEQLMVGHPGFAALSAEIAPAIHEALSL